MKTLAKFIAEYIIDKKDFDAAGYNDMLKLYTKEITEAIEAYKNHLRGDSPKTVHWRPNTLRRKATIERDLIVALERMQSQDSLEGTRHNKSSEAERICLQPAALETDFGCVKCSSLLACTNSEGHRCDECLLFDLTSQGNCRKPGYGTKADNHACDRFKLNANYKKQTESEKPVEDMTTKELIEMKDV